MKTARRHSAGISIVEIVVSAGIIAVAVLGITGAWRLYLKVANQSTMYAQGALMVEEAEEAITLMRDFSWSRYISPLTLNTNYYLYWNGSAYVATTTAQTSANGYIRTLVFRSVQRDSNSNIVLSSGIVDSRTKNVLITVVPANATTTVVGQSDMLIHNVYSN